MQHSSLSWPNSRNSYYNPVTKIQSLIRNLDAELMELCNQCTYPKSPAGTSPTDIVSRYKNLNPSSMLIAQQEASGGVQARTLSSIYRARVIDAYRNRRIFTVHGNYHTIRRALLRRGWIEKLAPGRYPKLQNLSEEVLLQHAKRGNDYEAVALSKIINHFPAFFVWQSKGQRDMYIDVLPYRNRVRRSRNLDFSTKVGLIGCAEQEHWYRQEGLSGMSHPRFYRLGGTFEERLSFIEDFRQTQCRSLMRYVVENTQNLSDIQDPDEGTIPLSTLHFAIARVKQQFADNEHNTLDDEHASTTIDMDSTEWSSFLHNASLILHKKAKFKGNVRDILDLARIARGILERADEKHPEYKWDGCRNLWILKPGYQCRGIGITIKHSLDEILQWCTNNTNRRYIAQKYVERPLLIYKTKFDIRQYMLLSIGENSISIWLYRDCYLRFSSQEYSVDDLRESIHLTNNSVQKKYKNKMARDPRLPKSNMWSLEQFKLYLKHQQQPEDTWNNKIFAGFKENLVAVVMASCDETDFVENTFEIYGCDFMLDENYQPILIEINSTPDLSPSTEVTSRICPTALKDLVKVIVDLPRNSRSNTGLFELVYEVSYRTKNDFDPSTGLAVNGKTMTLFKPMRYPYRQKFIKKLIKISKKAESNSNSNSSSPRKSKHLQEKEKTKSTSRTSTDYSPNKQLKGFAKEALALRYTQPK